MRQQLSQKISLTKIGLLFLLLWILEIAVMSGLFFQLYDSRDGAERLREEEKLVNVLMLTDFCLVTESRHTRHFNLPEPIAPFQDVPGFFDHFPSSTFLTPPSQSGDSLR